MSPIEDPTEALAGVIREVEAHAARSGWDQPAQLFALVETADLLLREPHLAELLDVEAQDQVLTPVEQETTSESLEELLASILWPPEVAGCAVVVEALTVPPDGGEVPTDAEAAAEYAAAHPNRQEARIVAGALRSGESFCAIRQRAHDDDDMVLAGPDLVPALLELLHTTLEPDAGDPPDNE
ncbi:MAG: PPA1309 family protein [Marmoricola sp.]